MRYKFLIYNSKAMVNTKKGFTLMELLIVIAIIAILTVAFLPGALKAPAKARDAGKIKTVNDIAIAVESWMAEKGTPPTSHVSYCLKAGVAPAGVPAAFLTSFKEGVLVDKQKQKSCVDAGGVAGVDDDKYFYYYKGGATPPFYVVAVRVELGSSANTSLTNAQAIAVAAPLDTKTNAENSIGGDASATPYYMIVGPM
jgi:prepilin-type N-terminal cleavage/methylation domain-containing protein